MFFHLLCSYRVSALLKFLPGGITIRLLGFKACWAGIYRNHEQRRKSKEFFLIFLLDNSLLSMQNQTLNSIDSTVTVTETLNAWPNWHYRNIRFIFKLASNGAVGHKVHPSIHDHQVEVHHLTSVTEKQVNEQKKWQNEKSLNLSFIFKKHVKNK